MEGIRKRKMSHDIEGEAGQGREEACRCWDLLPTFHGLFSMSHPGSSAVFSSILRVISVEDLHLTHNCRTEFTNKLQACCIPPGILYLGLEILMHP